MATLANDTPTKALAGYLLIARRAKELGVTLGDIARIAGTTRGAISQAAHGQLRSRRLRRAICNELRLHPDELGWNNVHVN